MAEQDDGRVGRLKASPYWRNLARNELFAEHGVPHKSYHKNGQGYSRTMYRWDPYERFTKSEDIRRFYSGYKYARYSLRDREEFAKFAIREILKDYPEDNYQVIGEIMKNESISLSSDSSQALDNLDRAVRAEGQHDVDAEIPKVANTRLQKDDDVEGTQKVSSAAQTIIAASPHSLGPPIDPCAAYLKMTRCGQYGRDQRSVWKSPLLPTLDNQDGRRGLLDHQVTGIVWLLSRLFGDLPTLKYIDPDTGQIRRNVENPFDEENRQRLKGPQYFGGILADSMGLGKTLITVALMSLLVGQGLNIVQAEDGSRKHRPILLVVPNATVASQWIQEIEQVIPGSIIPQIVVSAPGLEALPRRDRVWYLNRNGFSKWPYALRYMWYEKQPRASKVVLITTMECWALRTCKQFNGWGSCFTHAGRAFSLVVVDEAYKVKNSSTLNWRSIHYLERQFTLLLTATPCMNSLTDLFGLGRLLWTTPMRHLQREPQKWEYIEDTFSKLEDLDLLDEYAASHEYQLVAGHTSLLAKLLCKNRDGKGHDINFTRQYLRHFEKLAMLRRSPSSRIYTDWDETNSVSLDGLYPNVENYTVEISAGEAYDEKYQKVHIDLLIDYLQAVKEWVGEIDDKEGRRHWLQIQRLFQIATSSLDVYHINDILVDNDYSTKSDDIAKMRANGVNFLRLSQFLISSKEAKPATHIGFLKLATRNSPILRYVLHYIAENILTREQNGPIKKLLIIEQVPAIAFYYEVVLRFLGFECCCMHAQLTTEERQGLVDSFNSSANDSCQFLIQPYTVGFVGTNLHKSCSRVLVTSYSYSLPMQWQAIHRVIRVGQNTDVTVHRVKLTNSYHAFQESLQIKKILPELGSRAQGSTKDSLVQLLNLFQYEIREAWHSPEGQRLMEERNLLDDESEEKDRCGPPHRKRIKLEHETNAKVGKFSDPRPQKPGKELISAKPGDGSAGWYAEKDALGLNEFLQLHTRENYHDEFIGLPRKAKGLFNHQKNNLRRLLSYGNDHGNLSTSVWKETDLENSAVLERALELMLRVRLGAKELPMLPFPLIDLSQVPKSRRKQLQYLLSELAHKILDYDKNNTVGANRDLKEVIKGLDITKSLSQIERALEAHARYGDCAAADVKEETSEDEEISIEVPKQQVKVEIKTEVKEEVTEVNWGKASIQAQIYIDLTEDADESSIVDGNKTRDRDVILIDDSSDDDGCGNDTLPNNTADTPDDQGKEIKEADSPGQ